MLCLCRIERISFVPSSSKSRSSLFPILMGRQTHHFSFDLVPVLSPGAQTYLCLRRREGIPNRPECLQKRCQAGYHCPDLPLRDRTHNHMLCKHTFSSRKTPYIIGFSFLMVALLSFALHPLLCRRITRSPKNGLFWKGPPTV